jgi:hypothetical protein
LHKIDNAENNKKFQRNKSICVNYLVIICSFNH